METRITNLTSLPIGSYTIGINGKTISAGEYYHRVRSFVSVSNPSKVPTVTAHILPKLAGGGVKKTINKGKKHESYLLSEKTAIVATRMKALDFDPNDYKIEVGIFTKVRKCADDLFNRGCKPDFFENAFEIMNEETLDELIKYITEGSRLQEQNIPSMAEFFCDEFNNLEKLMTQCEKGKTAIKYGFTARFGYHFFNDTTGNFNFKRFVEMAKESKKVKEITRFVETKMIVKGS